MFGRLREFLERAALSAHTDSPKAQEHGVQLATAALLFEIVRADGEVRDGERRTMRAAVQTVFQLADGGFEDLIVAAEEASREAVSLWEATSVVDKGLPPEQKARVVQLLWRIAFADGRKDPVEEEMIRRIAGLLHVSHSDFIEAKLRAQSH